MVVRMRRSARGAMKIQKAPWKKRPGMMSANASARRIMARGAREGLWGTERSASMVTSWNCAAEARKSIWKGMTRR